VYLTWLDRLNARMSIKNNNIDEYDAVASGGSSLSLSADLSSLRVAIVHYWFLSHSGGERVVEAFASLFPRADLFALIARPETMAPKLRDRKLSTSFLQKIPQVHKFHRHTLMLQPLALEQFDLSDYDLVLSSESGPAKGIITPPKAMHICYCHSPMRYIWDMYPSYIRTMQPITRAIFSVAASYMRIWDYTTASRVDSFVCNSKFTASRVKKYYRRESEVIYPPVDVLSVVTSDQQEDFYLSVGRLVNYKRTDLAIEACKIMKRKLKIIGIGPEYKRLKKMADLNVEFLGSITDDEKHKVMDRCKALIFAGEEDFGIVPVEAQAHGKPVIAFGTGGVLETVNELGSYAHIKRVPTGVFFYEQSVASVVEAMVKFEANDYLFNRESIREHALQFDAGVFHNRIRQFIENKVCDAKKRKEE